MITLQDYYNQIDALYQELVVAYANKREARSTLQDIPENPMPDTDNRRDLALTELLYKHLRAKREIELREDPPLPKMTESAYDAFLDKDETLYGLQVEIIQLRHDSSGTKASVPLESIEMMNQASLDLQNADTRINEIKDELRFLTVMKDVVIAYWQGK